MFPVRYLASMLLGGVIAAAVFNDTAREKVLQLAKLAEKEIDKMVEASKEGEKKRFAERRYCVDD